MVKKVTTTVSTSYAQLGRKAIILGGTIIGGIIALAVAVKTDPEISEVVIVEETVETTVEIPEDNTEK